MCTRAEVDWTKVESDHAGVQIWWDICKKATRGPGLYKVNGSLLEDPLKHRGKSTDRHNDATIRSNILSVSFPSQLISSEH